MFHYRETHPSKPRRLVISCGTSLKFFILRPDIDNSRTLWLNMDS